MKQKDNAEWIFPMWTDIFLRVKFLENKVMHRIKYIVKIHAETTSINEKAQRIVLLQTYNILEWDPHLSLRNVHQL